MAAPKLLITIAGDNKELKAALRDAQSLTKDFGASLKSIGTALTAGLTTAITAVGAASLKLAADFQKNKIAFETLLPA